ncbi:hypothetical protein QKU48_gp0805 [Fadolivirus algeromassiliense]|uniref:Uncharacterized protein n=1 Tax=Fadolivirus FV1/VV64 TaxID=3070911 RepID=A0A7D3QUM7_9VIRU|nr:hypothetical protein QKU48_gp0805 [Fadolivirus algeromassiliense]QKF94263.1 hypothetical protein Fadolivirus_1_805 [Fadolivirus FV1/VV64]
MSMDALAYATITNNISDNNTLQYFQQYLNDNALPPGGTKNFTSNMDGAKATLDKILTNTQQKRACCLGNTKVDVRIPKPDGVTLSGLSTGQTATKYGYYDKPDVAITQGVCSNLDGDKKPYDKSNDKCNNFGLVYCKNVVDEYKKLSGSDDFNYTEFGFYKPECLCYAPMPQWAIDATSGGAGLIPRCLIPGCDPGKATVGTQFLDPASQKDTQCASLCANFTNIQNVTAGRDVKLNVENMCKSSTGGSGTQTQPPSAPQPPASPSTPSTPLSDSIFGGSPSTPSSTPSSDNTSKVSPSTPSSTNSSLPIIGGGVGSLVCCCCCILILVLLMRRRR